MHDIRFIDEVLVYARYSPEGVTAGASNYIYHVQAVIEIIKENLKWNKGTDNLARLYEMLMGSLLNLTNNDLEECKNTSMPYIFSNRSISDRIIENIKMINGLKKSTLINEEKYSVLYKLFKKSKCMDKLSAYIDGDSIHTIAIYGYGDIGKILIDYLKELNIRINYIVDRNEKIDTPHRLIQPDDELPKVDLLIITIIDNEFKTTNLMKSKLDGHVVRLQDLL